MVHLPKHIYHKNHPNRGKYTSPLDPMGHSGKREKRDNGAMFLHTSATRFAYVGSVCLRL